MVWSLMLCVLNWIGTEYVLIDNVLYVNHSDLSKRTIQKVTTFIRSKTAEIFQKPYSFKTKAY
jgi:hypothetical protein